MLKVLIVWILLMLFHIDVSQILQLSNKFDKFAS